MLKTITGHTGCAGVMDYLRKGSKDDRRKRRIGEISEADSLRMAAKGNGIAGYFHSGHDAEFDRALAEDFIGIPPSAQKDWARYMDDRREARRLRQEDGRQGGEGRHLPPLRPGARPRRRHRPGHAQGLREGVGREGVRGGRDGGDRLPRRQPRALEEGSAGHTPRPYLRQCAERGNGQEMAFH